VWTLDMYVTDEWTKAIIVPVYKKGEASLAMWQTTGYTDVRGM